MLRLVIVALSALPLTALATALSTPPAVNTACPPGETGVTNDYANTGLCLPEPPLPPNNVVPQ